ncbi:Zinc finger protein 705A [Camelus dromedarius]|uniref:Zinc finger protein 705A n=1 Tax=Camelus dromedarius TaxID=9838 RepID=A0A5N4CFG4_CAMDR|nr:Zinc finger protein 705A [Camelus dromedarius]
MLENLSHLVSVGYQHCKSDVIFQLEQGEELWTEGGGFLQSHSPGIEGALRKEVLATQHIRREDMSTVIPGKQVSHSPEGPFECNGWGGEFTHSSMLSQHLVTPMEKTHCINKKCQKSLSDHSNLNQPKQGHTRGWHRGPSLHVHRGWGVLFIRRSLLPCFRLLSPLSPPGLLYPPAICLISWEREGRLPQAFISEILNHEKENDVT